MVRSQGGAASPGRYWVHTICVAALKGRCQPAGEVRAPDTEVGVGLKQKLRSWERMSSHRRVWGEAEGNS